jgi:hypothetical protein
MYPSEEYWCRSHNWRKSLDELARPPHDGQRSMQEVARQKDKHSWSNNSVALDIQQNCDDVVIGRG